ncbi:NAD-dependent epimerase/dehydratase family protein [Streptomyces tubercidicus]|uniref:NAD-dependent epimerase/dehydratase family protein n=1 Tax=Streptomyces tubercidicus TaxID=47759 RepID=UPI003465D3E9
MLKANGSSLRPADDPDGTHRRVLVLGATGAVGRHVCAAVRAAGDEVLMVARRPGTAAGAGRFFPMDLIGEGPDGLARLIDAERPYAVVNAAGAAWQCSPEVMRQANHALVDKVLAATAAASWRPRLVHVGSVHEYTPQPPGTSLDERTPTQPTTLYGRTKLQGTESVRTAAAAGQVDAVVLRVSNTIGAGTSPGSLLGRVAAQLRAAGADQEAVVRVSPLRASRDFVDARDAAHAVLAAAALPTGNELLNIGRGEATPVRTMVERLITVSGRQARIVETPEPGVGAAAAQDWMRVETGRARRLLHWAVRHDIDSSAHDLWQATATAAPEPQSPGLGRPAPYRPVPKPE